MCTMTRELGHLDEIMPHNLGAMLQESIFAVYTQVDPLENAVWIAQRNPRFAIGSTIDEFSQTLLLPLAVCQSRDRRNPCTCAS